MADDSKMNESELLTVIKSQLGDTIKYADDDFKRTNIDLDEAYRQIPYGNEEDEHSRVISPVVYDTVESDMPAFARTFLGVQEIMKFTPLTADDQEECEQKTRYANFLIRGQKDSFATLHGLLKEPGKSVCSVAYFYVDKKEEPQYVRYENINADELVRVVESLEGGEDVTRVEVESQTSTAGEAKTFDVRFRVVTETQTIRIRGVQPESFILSRGAISKDEAMMVGHESLVTKGELIADGYKKKDVFDLPTSRDSDGTELKELRFRNKGGWDQQSGYHWTNEKVRMQTLFPMVDFDGDGIPERRMVVKCGEKIFENEPFGIVPYAIFSQLLEPHSALGESRGTQAAKYQLKQTAVERGLMDNIYAHNRPRLGVDDSDGSIDGGMVNLDDATSHRIDGLIRTDGPPGNALLPILTPYVGDKSLQVIQYIDSQKSVTLGNQLANQGFQGDSLYNETATRFEGVEEAQAAKIELVNRVYAETGFRQLFEGVIYLAQHYQDTATEIMVLGKPLIVDPASWKSEHYCQSQVGLGAGDGAEAIANLGALVQQQIGLIQMGSPLADWSKVYNSLNDISKIMGKPDTSQYFNNPEIPEERMQADNMQLTQMVQQLQQQLEQVGSMADAEKMKAQASVENTKLTTQQKEMQARRDHEVDIANVAMKQEEIGLKKQEATVKSLQIIADIKQTQADTQGQELENAGVATGLNKILEMVVSEAASG